MEFYNQNCIKNFRISITMLHYFAEKQVLKCTCFNTKMEFKVFGKTEELVGMTSKQTRDAVAKLDQGRRESQTRLHEWVGKGSSHDCAFLAPC